MLGWPQGTHCKSWCGLTPWYLKHENYYYYYLSLLPLFVFITRLADLVTFYPRKESHQLADVTMIVARAPYPIRVCLRWRCMSSDCFQLNSDESAIYLAQWSNLYWSVCSSVRLLTWQSLPLCKMCALIHDQELTLLNHVNNACHTCHYHLCQICSVLWLLSKQLWSPLLCLQKSILKMLYLYFRLGSSLTFNLQSVLNTSACLIGGIPKSGHMPYTRDIGGDLAPSLGGRKKFSRTKISEWRYFLNKFPFSRQQFLMTFF